eukprot:scaffold2184_cov266-Chaetoceros_neogracile.AAC.13
MKFLFVILCLLDAASAFTMKQGLKLSPLVSSYVKAPRPIKYNTNLNMAQKLTNDEFWEAQKRMAGNLSDAVNEEEKKERAIIIFSAIWLLSPNPFTALSYMLGAILGTAYTYGLGKFVESIGGSAYDAEDVKGSGVGSARFAFLIVLFIFVGKFRSEGLQEIPSIMGFFTYQISTLSQGLKDANSDDLY